MEMVIRHSEQFQRKVRRRNATEYIAAAVLVAWAGLFVARSEAPPVIKAGVALIALGGIAVATILRRRGAEGTPPLAATTREMLAWHQSELLRQRDLLRRVPLWYLGPFVPGLVLSFAGAWLERPDQALRLGLGAALVVTVLAIIVLINLRGARKLDEQIDGLRRQSEE